LLIAALPDGGVLLGLGGNPVAAVAGAALCVPTLRDALLGARPGPPEYLSVLDAAAVAHPDLWRVVPVCPDGAGGWLASAITSTAELRSLIGARTLALVPPASAGSARRLV
jgi:molybdopterin biosynthesis enzyme